MNSICQFSNRICLSKILMLSLCIFIMTCNIFFLRDFTRRVEQPGFLLSVCQEWFASQLKRDGVRDAKLPTNLRQKWALLSSLYLLRSLHLVFLRHPVELKKERKKNYNTHTRILSIKAADRKKRITLIAVQYCAGKPWVLALLVLTLLWHIPHT